MGYSVSVRARTEDLAVRMEEFFAREYRTYQQVWGFEEGDQFSTPPSRDFDYRPTRNPKLMPRYIGISYNAACHERVYVFTLGHWMALKIGDTKRSFQDPKISFEQPVPFMHYDVESGWPVLNQPLETTPEKVRWCCVDPYGVPLQPPSELAFSLNPEVTQPAFKEATEKLGKDGRPTHESHDLMIQILAPEIWKLVEPLRAEMQRLDQRWQESNP